MWTKGSALLSGFKYGVAPLKFVRLYIDGALATSDSHLNEHLIGHYLSVYNPGTDVKVKQKEQHPKTFSALERSMIHSEQ